jgi:hypothetical protein
MYVCIYSACHIYNTYTQSHTYIHAHIHTYTHMCTGVLDKNHVGASANGLVHAVFEAHGPRKAGLFLTILGRLFTHFQQVRACFYVYVYMCVCIYIYICVCVCVYIHLMVPVCMCKYVCIYIYIYIYIYMYIRSIAPALAV